MWKNAVELSWFRRHLLQDILPRWQAAVTPEGLFHCHFDYAWQREDRNFGTLVSQTRLIYNFCQGYILTDDPWYQDAVEAGTDFLVEKFWDADYGGWFKACSPEGDIVDDSKDCYGHAFVIFGLAHALTIIDKPQYREALAATWQVLSEQFHDEFGGYRYFMSRDFSHTEPLRSQNPLMHLFEALLAAGDIPGMSDMHQEAESLADFILQQLVHDPDRVLPEVYDPAWQPLPREQDGRIDVGHAFEWAYLFSAAAERGLGQGFHSEADHFLDTGLRLGLDREHGGIFSPVAPDGTRTTDRKGWWEQCETIRALLRLADLHARDDLLAPLPQMVAYIQDEFLDPEYGGWYLYRLPGESPSRQPKGHEAKLDYHVVGMCMEAIRVEDATTDGA